MALGGSDGMHVHHGRDQPFRILQALRSAGRPPGHVTSVTTAPANQQPIDSTDSQSGHHRDGLTCEPKAYNAAPTHPEEYWPVQPDSPAMTAVVSRGLPRRPVRAAGLHPEGWIP
jgi:hypothetical protein